MGFGKDGKGVIIRETRSVALGTLDVSTGIIVGTNIDILERFRMLKAQIVATLTGLTSGEGEGLALYLVSGDLTLAEFEASIELTGPVGPNDSVVAAIADRWSMWCGGTTTSGGAEQVFVNPEGGPLLEVIPRWTFARTKSWNWIVYNHGVQLTTGSTVFLKCKDFGVWVI